MKHKENLQILHSQALENVLMGKVEKKQFYFIQQVILNSCGICQMHVPNAPLSKRLIINYEKRFGY